MAKQTFTTGQVLTAAQVNALQLNDYNQTVSAKVASYTLVASDAGTRITMSNASATTITVNTSLFAAGDTLFITNIGAGALTITAGSATVSTASSRILAQYDSGTLYFTSTGVAIWEKYQGTTTGGGKVLQVVQGTTTTSTSNATATYADTTLTATITPTLNTSKVLIMAINQGAQKTNATSSNQMSMRLMRGATSLGTFADGELYAATTIYVSSHIAINYLDSPATTSATTYKTQFMNGAADSAVTVQTNSVLSTIILMEIGA